MTTGVIRGVDVGRKHLVVTADTNGGTMIHDMRHRSILREIRYLQSIKSRKGKRRKRKIEKKINQLRQQANNITNDTMNRIVNAVTSGVDKVVLAVRQYLDNIRMDKCCDIRCGQGGTRGFITEINDQSWWEPQKNDEPLHAREPGRRVPPESGAKVRGAGD